MFISLQNVFHLCLFVALFFVWLKTIFLSIYWKMLGFWPVFLMWIRGNILNNKQQIYWKKNVRKHTDWKPSHANKLPNKNSSMFFSSYMIRKWLNQNCEFIRQFFFLNFSCRFFRGSHVDRVLYVLQENAFIQLFRLR